MARWLVGCERSGVIRNALRKLGHDAWSNDLEPADDGSEYHLQMDVREALKMDWDGAILHPVCTRLTNAGVRWLRVPPPGKTLEEMWAELDAGAELFSVCLNAARDYGIKHVAVENPVMHRYAKERIRNYRDPDFSYQPHHFGVPQLKLTQWWTVGLPKLIRTHFLHVPPVGSAERREWSAVHQASQSADRPRKRSQTLRAVANAIAMQWGHIPDGAKETWNDEL